MERGGQVMVVPHDAMSADSDGSVNEAAFMAASLELGPAP